MEKRINVSLPPELLDRLTATAAREERSVPALIRILIRRGLEAIEAAGS